MRNLTEKRLARLRTEGRLDYVRGDGVAPDGTRSTATVSLAADWLKSKWGTHSFAASSFSVNHSAFVRAAKNTNVIYFVNHGGQWTEALFVHATNDRIVPLRKATYDPTSGWTIHLGHPGGLVRASMYEAWIKIKPV